MLALGIILAVAFFALSLRKPILSFGLILALLPIYLVRLEIQNLPTTVLEIMVGLFLFAVMVKFGGDTKSWKKIQELRKFNWVIAAFFLAAVISVVISPEKTRALGQLKAFFIEPILLFYAALVVFKDKRDLRLPLQLLFTSTALISVFGLVQYWTHLFLPLRFWGYGEEVKRITSVFEYPNALALYLAPLFIFFLTLLVKGYNLGKKTLVVLGLAAMFIAITLTFSRGALLALFAGLTVLILRQTGVSLRRWVVIGAVGFLIISPLLFTRFQSTFHDKSSSERMALYKTAAQKIVSGPILGNGLYGFRTTLENSKYTGEILNYPHNIIFNFWLETGMLGVLSFVLLMYYSLRQYSKTPTVLGLAAALYLLVMFVHGMVDAPYFKNDLSILFWFMLAIFFVKVPENKNA